jgi:hypothetical protein
VSAGRAAALAIVVTGVVVGVTDMAFGVPLPWAILIGLPAGAVAVAGGLLGGAVDADWTAEPEPSAAGVTLHATFLTERLERSAIDQYRFTSRVQPRLRHLATAVVQRRLSTDLTDPRARELLGDDLHRLLTATDAQLPPATTFAALMRRLEELC